MLKPNPRVRKGGGELGQHFNTHKLLLHYKVFFIYHKSYAYVYWYESLPEAVIFLLLSLVLKQILVIKSYIKRKISLFYCAMQRTQITSWIMTTSDLLNLDAFAKITKSINQSFEKVPTPEKQLSCQKTKHTLRTCSALYSGIPEFLLLNFHSKQKNHIYHKHLEILKIKIFYMLI